MSAKRHIKEACFFFFIYTVEEILLNQFTSNISPEVEVRNCVYIYAKEMRMNHTGYWGLRAYLRLLQCSYHGLSACCWG